MLSIVKLSEKFKAANYSTLHCTICKSIEKHTLNTIAIQEVCPDFSVFSVLLFNYSLILREGRETSRDLDKLLHCTDDLLT